MGQELRAFTIVLLYANVFECLILYWFYKNWYLSKTEVDVF